MKESRVCIVNCQYCNKEFKVFLCKIADGRGKYCSMSCGVKARVGEKHPNFNRDTFRRVIEGKAIYQYRLIAQKALGRNLKQNESVHHFNGDRTDKNNSNLIVCDESFHPTLHRRKRALANCGHADWRKCGYCHQYDNPENLKIYGSHCHHQKCNNDYRRNRNAHLRGNFPGHSMGD